MATPSNSASYHPTTECIQSTVLRMTLLQNVPLHCSKMSHYTAPKCTVTMLRALHRRDIAGNAKHNHSTLYGWAIVFLSHCSQTTIAIKNNDHQSGKTTITATSKPRPQSNLQNHQQWTQTEMPRPEVEEAPVKWCPLSCLTISSTVLWNWLRRKRAYVGRFSARLVDCNNDCHFSNAVVLRSQLTRFNH